MNDEVLETAKAQVDIAVLVHRYLIEQATEIVDDLMPFKAEIGKATLENERNSRMTERETAIGAVVANLIVLCTELRT